MKLTGLKFKLLLRYLEIDKNWRNDGLEKKWLATQWNSGAIKSYIYPRLQETLKEIANAVADRDYYKALESNGKRLELLKLAGKAKVEADKADKEKKLKRMN